ncbi:MAG: hypothetical protein ACREOG_00620, partial [Gemmatimonadaceae bacterium]
MTVRLPMVGLLAAATLSGAATAGAQVGHLPQRSPYRDVFVKHSLTYFAGYYSGATDPGKVAPNDGPMVGARYAIRLGGPVYFTGRLAGVFTDRSVIDPTLPPA